MKPIVSISLIFALFGAGCASSSPAEPQTPSTPPAVKDVTPAVTSTQPTPAPISATTSAQAPTPTKIQTAPRTTTTKTPTTQLQPNAPKVTKPGPATLSVSITDSAFSPQTLAVNAGDTVVWVNKGVQNHTSASDGALIWDSGNIPPGSSYRRTFPYAGSYAYHDGAHPTIRGTIVVH